LFITNVIKEFSHNTIPKKNLVHIWLWKLVDKLNEMMFLSLNTDFLER
jgi:hypothetical protein